VQAGKGLVGAALKDEQLARDLRTITGNLSITTSNLNRLGLWRFLWHREQPPKPNQSRETQPRK
jgi:hypothetical protein